MSSGLVLHCLPMSHKKDTRLLWVKIRLVVQEEMWFEDLSFSSSGSLNGSDAKPVV